MTPICQSTALESEARQGGLYVGKLVVWAFGILFCFASLKFFAGNLLAPTSTGIGGVLSQPRLDLLLMGSSHTRKSYDMRLLANDTGVTNSFQIAYDGADLNVISQMLDYLAARPEHCPRRLVVEAYSAFLSRKPNLQDPRYFAEVPPTLKMEIIRTYISAHRDFSVYLDIFDLIVNRGNESIVTYPISAPIMDRGSYKGGRRDFYFPGTTPEAFASMHPKLENTVPDPAQLAALSHIIDVARTHDIRLIFVDPPMPLPVASNADFQSLKKDFREIVTAHNLPYIDGDKLFPIDDPSLFSDITHLSSKGREVFTPIISIQLNAWMASHPVAGN